MTIPGGFLFAVPITRAWRTAEGGLIPMPHSEGEFEGYHAVLGIGFADDSKLITFINCWGKAWGRDGLGYLPYEYFSRYFNDAWAFYPPQVGTFRPQRPDTQFSHRLLMYRNALHNVCVMVDLWDWGENVRIGWAMSTLRDGYFDVEDFFIRPEFRGSGHQSRLIKLMQMHALRSGFPMRLWIAHADVNYRASNFSVMNYVLRATGLKAKVSPVSWAAYVAS